MADSRPHLDTDLIALTTEIVAAHVSNTPTDPEELSRLISQVHGTLSQLAAGKNPGADGKPPAAARPQPAVPVDQSMTDDYLICLEDGKKLKMLKRHLRTRYNMTPEEYRARWGLPADYPMVAPNYSRRRSQLAKDIGLGTQPGKTSGRSKSAGRKG